MGYLAVCKLHAPRLHHILLRISRSAFRSWVDLPRRLHCSIQDLELTSMQQLLLLLLLEKSTNSCCRLQLWISNVWKKGT